MRNGSSNGAAAKKPRPVSAVDAMTTIPDAVDSPGAFKCNRGGGSDYRDSEQQLLLLMYIVGGREVGQVTVFRRPISVWRLDLTKTF